MYPVLHYQQLGHVMPCSKYYYCSNHSSRITRSMCAVIPSLHSILLAYIDVTLTRDIDLLFGDIDPSESRLEYSAVLERIVCR